MSKSLEDVRRDIATTISAIKPLAEKLDILRRAESALASKQFIEVNNIHTADVEFSDGADRPYFGHIGDFIKWLSSTKSRKRWAEWNGRIYYMSDLFAGRMPDGMPGFKEDLLP